MQLPNDWSPSPESMCDAFVDWYNKNIADYDMPEIKHDEVYVVWFCYTVGNAKALISTVRHDHMYYEMTYSITGGCDSIASCVFVDQYLKVRHSKIDKEQED